jgi:perosamine synthetase
MIPLTVPNISSNAWKYIKECLDTGWVSSAGEYVTKFENMLADYCQVDYAVATVNGTSAIHIALLLAGVERDHYVIVPNLTFVASVNPISYLGAKPILIDVDPKTWQMDLPLLEKFLEQKAVTNGGKLVLKQDGKEIKAIMPVHILGNTGDIDTLLSISKKYNVKIIEDASESLGTRYKGKHTGTFGEMGCLSFNGNKIITTGGGGMILTNDKALAKKAKHLTTQAKIKEDEYFHDEVGFNYRLVNLLAALGVSQMEDLDDFVRRKSEIASFYRDTLINVGDISFQELLPMAQSNNWLFTIKTSKRKELQKYLQVQKILTRPFWVPMNQLPMYCNDHYVTISDESAKVYNDCLSLPCSTSISEDELQQVSKAIKSFFAAN